MDFVGKNIDLHGYNKKRDAQKDVENMSDRQKNNRCQIYQQKSMKI